MAVTWNPWHGCHKYTEGCQNCYVFRMDARHERDSSIIKKTGNFNLPIKRNRQKEWKIPSGTLVATCFTSDFFLEDADPWRSEAWQMIYQRPDLSFLFITKRILRFYECIPDNWGNGYKNVHICCTAENQKRADERLSFFKSLPIYHKSIVLEPLLGPVDISPYIGSWTDEVLAGGESGSAARPCNYDWILDIRRQCMEKEVPFTFRQTGANFIKDGKTFRIQRPYQHRQAKKANINYCPAGRFPARKF